MCGEAEVEIKKIGEYESGRIQIIAKNKDHETSLWLHSVDHIKSLCITSSKNQNKILINAFCGGSGCSEQTYTIIDARTLMVELVPVQGRNNKSIAEHLLGKKINE